MSWGHLHGVAIVAGLASIAAQLSAAETAVPAIPSPKAFFYVAPTGDDTNSGAEDRPFATLERARDAVRGLKQKSGMPAGGVAVVIRGGMYRLARSFLLDREDSGTEGSPIVYRAAEGEVPRFLGGVRLTAWTPVSDGEVLARLPEESRDKVLQCDLKPHGLAQLKPLRLGGFASGLGFTTHPTMELFFDGRAMPMSRWPNEGWARVVAVIGKDGREVPPGEESKSGLLVYQGDRPNRWKADRDVLLYGYWFFDWADSYERVASIDTAHRRITLEPPFHKYGYQAGQRYCAVNLLSEIDMPGEWYIDRDRGVLYFYPPSDPRQSVVELSTVLAPLVELREVSHLAFQGLCLELGGADGVVVRGGQRCMLAGCTLRRLAGDGVKIDGGFGHGVLSCDICSLGRGGVSVAGGDRKTLAPGGHFVENCHVYELSRIDHTYTPAVRMTGVGNRIRHNLFHDVASSAINLQGNDHLVEFNEIYHAVCESDDQGGVDMFGNPTFRGNIYRYNYFHHIGPWRDPANGSGCGHAGIRLDDAICGVKVYGNVFYRCAGGKYGFGGVQIHGGKENLVENNIFVDCLTAVSFSSWSDERWRKFTAASLDAPEIDKALYLTRYPELARLSEDHNVNTISRNLAVRCGQFDRRAAKGVRLEGNVTTAEDPGFSDAAAGRFGLSDAASGLPMGFKPIPFDRIGLYRDALRKELPTKAVDDARAGLSR